MNRIEASIATHSERIESLNGVGLNGTPLSEVEEELTLTFEEFVAFQNEQARAHAGGTISSDEAMTVYRLLGGESHADDKNHGWPKGVTLAEKMVVTNLMGELMGRRLGR